MKLAILFTAGLVWVIMLVGCDKTDSPETTTLEWLQAVEDSDGLKMDSLTCSEKKLGSQKSNPLLSAFDAIAEDLTSQSLKIDTTDLKVTMVSGNEQKARVRVQGQARAAIGLVVETQPIDDIWRLVQEDGKWKVCGSDNLTRDDLTKQLLQPSQPPFSELKCDDVLEASGRDLGIELERANAFVGLVCRTDVMKMFVTAILFEDSTSAEVGYEDHLPELCPIMTEAFNSETFNELDASGLGEEGKGYFFSEIGSGSFFVYVWQTRNAVMCLGAQGLAEPQVRSMAEQIQTRAE